MVHALWTSLSDDDRNRSLDHNSFYAKEEQLDEKTVLVPERA